MILNNRPYQVVFLRFLFFFVSLARFMGKSSNLTNIKGIFQLGCVHQQLACMFFWGCVAATRDLHDLLGRMFCVKKKPINFGGSIQPAQNLKNPYDGGGFNGVTTTVSTTSPEG